MDDNASDSDEGWPDNHPDVIRAKGEAYARKLEARAKLHPAAQVLYTFFDGIGNLFMGIGCLGIIALVILGFAGALTPMILAIFGPH